jgi:hypothetical protein
MAIRDMDVAAAVIGIRPVYAKLTAFAVSSFIVGVAGALWGFVHLGSWEPAAFNIDRSFQLLFMVIIGGLGSIMGSFFGAAFIVMLPILLNQLLPARARFGMTIDTATGLALRVHDLRRPDRLLPDRRTARPGPAVVHRQGKAAPVALPALMFLATSSSQAIRSSTDECISFPPSGGRHHEIRSPLPWPPRWPAGLGRPAASGRLRAGQGAVLPGAVYRTGPYAPNGTPWANGLCRLHEAGQCPRRHQRREDPFEECETGYATDRGVECYERLKGKNGGATVFQPLSTGITFALTEKAPADKIPLITAGYGRSDSADGGVFKWNFPLIGTYWVAADALLQHIAKKEGGWDKLKGKKIALVYHDSPYGKEPIALLQERSKMHGFDLQLLPVTASGRRAEGHLAADAPAAPDYVLLWGWGVMNSTALKEAVATGYPREKMYGTWWSGAEPDVKDVGDGAKGYNA